MKERGISMGDPMVVAIFDDRKTQTRRVMKEQPPKGWGGESERFALALKNPYGQAGDRLYVRETIGIGKMGGNVIYRADGGWAAVEGFAKSALQKGRWVIPRFMAKKYSRQLLEIVSVRVERAQEITEADAKAEGAFYHIGPEERLSGWTHDKTDVLVFRTARDSFIHLWKKINGKDSWAENPFCWVIEFKRVVI